MSTLSDERLAYERARERTGKCVRCGSRGPLFTLPTGQEFCFGCTEVYVSWESEGGRADDPDMFAWLWEDDVAASAPAVPVKGEGR